MQHIACSEEVDSLGRKLEERVITNMDGIIPFEYSTANQLKVCKIWSVSLCIGWALGLNRTHLVEYHFLLYPNLNYYLTKTELVEKKYFS